MDKRKLVNIIVNDLEELKFLSEEVVDSQDNSLLVVDLLLNKARLLVQEIELLRELAAQAGALHQETEEYDLDEENELDSVISFSDPELEILNFEEKDSMEPKELLNEQDIDIEEETEKNDREDFEEEDVDESDTETMDDLADDDEEEAEEDNFTEGEEENIEEDDDDNDKDEDDEDDINDEDEQEDENANNLEDKESQQITNIQITELNNEPQPGIREIHIDDPDDDDNESINFSTIPGSFGRPPMREIPKPENPVIGETFQKERSVNDTIGENKSTESKLTNVPISSLRAAIGLNDRFIFIREIFDNDSEKYNIVIDHLDKMEHIQQAVDYLRANLRMEKNEASLKFVDLLKRRFTK